MPTYEYKCEECGERFDYFQKITDPPLERCIKCHGRVRRLISGGSGFIFKGSGFYCTDYRDKPAPAEKAAAPAEKPACPAGKPQCQAAGQCCQSGQCCHCK